MPKIISAFSGDSGLADTMARLGQSLWGDKTANMLNSEKLYAAQRENTELDNLMKRVAAAKAQTLGSDPAVQAMLIGAGYDPSKFAAIGRMGAATEYGATDDRTANWQVAAGDPYSATAPAFNATLAETTRAHDQQSADRRYGVDQAQLTERSKPMAALGADGRPIFVPTQDAVTSGAQPILSNAERVGTLLGENWANLPALNPQQQEVLGARVSGDKAGTPKNYILPGGKTVLTYDGRTDVFGQALPPGGYIGTVQGSASDTGVTNAVSSDLQTDTIANKKFNFLVDQGLALTQDPTLFGPLGFTRSIGQDVAQGIKGVADLFQNGQPGAAALADAQTELAQSVSPDVAQRLLPELYDPNLPKVQTIWGLLVYSGASALAGQENRSVSDKDVQAMKEILGSPQSMFTSAEAMRAKLEQAREIVKNFDAVSREALGGKAPVTPYGGEQQPEVKQNTGQPMQIRSADEYNALPAGAQYLDPNGVLRTKGAR